MKKDELLRIRQYLGWGKLQMSKACHCSLVEYKKYENGIYRIPFDVSAIAKELPKNFSPKRLKEAIPKKGYADILRKIEGGYYVLIEGCDVAKYRRAAQKLPDKDIYKYSIKIRKTDGKGIITRKFY